MNPFQAAIDDLARLETAVGFDGPLGQALLDLAVEHLAAGFDAERSPDGTPWPRLDPTYEGRKAKRWPGAPIGVAEGLMRRGLDPGSGQYVFTATTAEWTYGDDDLQRSEATWFQDHATNPERRFVGMSDGMRAEVRETIRRFIQEAL